MARSKEVKRPTCYSHTGGSVQLRGSLIKISIHFKRNIIIMAAADRPASASKPGQQQKEKAK